MKYLSPILTALLILAGCSAPNPLRHENPVKTGFEGWVLRHQERHKQFLAAQKKSIQSYKNVLLQSASLDATAGAVSIPGGSLMLFQAPGETLPTLRYLDQHHHFTGEEIALSIPDTAGHEPELVRIAPSGNSIAVVYVLGAKKKLCLLHRSEIPICSEMGDLYDVLWDVHHDTLFGTFFDQAASQWTLVSFDKILKASVITSMTLPSGYLLLSKKNDQVLVERRENDAKTFYILDTTRIPVALKPTGQNGEEITSHKCNSMQQSYTSLDGSKIPYITSTSVPAPKAVVLRFYGAYGIALQPVPEKYLLPFSEADILFIDLWIRGGGECGRAWADAGSGKLRVRAAEDLLAAVRFFNSAYHRAPIFLMTRSAGGILAAIAASETSSAISGLLLDAPFLSLEDWRHSAQASRERSIWGDFDTTEGKEAIAALQQRIQGTEIPTFLWLGLQDSIVPPTWSKKWVDTSPNVIVNIDPLAGHEGPLTRQETEELYAQKFAFIAAVVE